MKPTIRADRLLKGLEALRSDRFTQGTGKLRRRDDDGIVKHCCLGVLTEIALEDPEFVVCDQDKRGSALMVLDDSSSNEEIIWTINANTLSYSVRDYYGLPDDDPQLKERLEADDHAEHECGGPDDCSYEDTYSASNANDDNLWTFDEIADAFERTYLQNQETENASE